MRPSIPLLALALALPPLLTTCTTPAPPPETPTPPPLPLDLITQRHYLCHRTPTPLLIDGRLDEPAWLAAPLTTPFADISGPAHPTPPLTTRARMLWDDTHFYIAAVLEEPHLWATLTARDSVIFYDHDFEVFIDPDGDTHLYAELEINALGTEWDLLLVKPYRSGGPAIHAWDIPSLRSAVHLDGTLNDPSDIDRGWSVEIAIPWSALSEITRAAAPPEPGDVWWVNFSRVEWDLQVTGETYVKTTDPSTNQPLPEHNWVWSPQGVIDMHRPETWGLVQFSGSPPTTSPPHPFTPPDDLPGRFALRRLHEAQRAYRETHGRYATDLTDLGLATLDLPSWSWPPRLTVTDTTFEAVLERPSGAPLHITHDGRIWAAER